MVQAFSSRGDFFSFKICSQQYLAGANSGLSPSPVLPHTFSRYETCVKDSLSSLSHPLYCLAQEDEHMYIQWKQAASEKHLKVMHTFSSF